MAAESSKDLVSWFDAPPGEIAEYLDDTVQDVLDSPIEYWQELAAHWASQSKGWKNTASSILDRLDDRRRTILLRELLKTTSVEDCTTVTTLVSQLDCAALPSDLQNEVRDFLSRKWAQLPEQRRYIEVACKACGLKVRFAHGA